MYVFDAGNFRVRKIVMATRVVTTVAGSGIDGQVDSPNCLLCAKFHSGVGLAMPPDDSYLLLADMSGVRKIDFAAGSVTTIAGGTSNDCKTGVGTNAAFSILQDIKFSRSGKYIYLGNAGCGFISRVAVDTNVVTNVVGIRNSATDVDGSFSAASFYMPLFIAGPDVSDTMLYVGTQKSLRLVVISAFGNAWCVLHKSALIIV